LPQTFLAICRSINKNKKTHSGKHKSTGSYKSRYSLRTSRRTYCKEIMSYGNIKNSTAYDAEKKFEKLIKMNRANMRRLQIFFYFNKIGWFSAVLCHFKERRKNS
jgi:hypothetical protein